MASTLPADPVSQPAETSSAASAKVPVSILIPVLNEARNLPRALASIAWADEIVVVDSQSTDETVSIAEAAGTTVVQFYFNGTWPKKKNWALDNVPWRNSWVFILDADETLPPEAEDEFRAIVTNPNPAHAGYWINRRFMFMGRWLKHAYFPNWNLRLFLHEKGRMEKLTEAETVSGDNEVHEHIVVQGTTDRLQCLMDHYAFPDVDTFIEKHNRYSNWEARVALEGQHHDGPQDGTVHRRRRLKRIAQKLPFRPLLRFLYVYLVQGGILDGRPGYYFARLHATYELLTVAKTYELKSQQDDSANPAARQP